MAGFPGRFQLTLIVEAAEHSGSGEEPERLHPAKKWMSRILARTSHLAVKLSIAITAGSAGSQACVVCRARWPKIRTKTTLTNQSIATE